MPLLFTPRIHREEVRHGQGVLSYAQANVLVDEHVHKQNAPDPVRQSDVHSRPSRRQVAVMANPATWGIGLAELFKGETDGHLLTARHAPGRGGIIRGHAMQTMDVRPNMGRPAALAYGSLFELDTANTIDAR